MTNAAFIALLLVNGGILLLFYGTIYRKEGAVSPLVVVLTFYLLSYPLRALMIYVAVGTDLESAFKIWEWGFTREEICVSLAYATLFMGTAVTFYGILTKRTGSNIALDKRRAQPSGLNTAWRRLIFFGLFGTYMLLFGYKIFSGELFGLYDSINDLKRPFFTNLLNLLADLKWFLTTYALLRIQRRKSPEVIILTGCVVGTIAISALVTTSKGDLVILAVLWAICVWLVRGKIPKFTVAVAVSAVILFAFYSYTARKYDYYGVRSLQGASTLESVQRTANTVMSMHRENDELWKQQAGKIFSRFDGMDSLILCQRVNPLLEEGLYIAGSIVELGNAIPRPLWPSRPHLSFNHFTTHAVWGQPDDAFLEMPIGRIGESFYVLNWGGVLYALLYAFIWHWLYRTLMLRSKNDLETAFYLCVLALMVLPDAYLVYNWKRLVVVCAAYFFLSSNGRIRLKRKRKRANEPADSPNIEAPGHA